MISDTGRQRELKDYIWSWNAEKKELHLFNKQSQVIFKIDKVRTCSLMRFLITVLQYPNSKKRIKNEKEK